MTGRTDSTVRDQKVLAEVYLHPVRGKTLSALSESPGASISELSGRIGQPWRRVRPHLEALLEAGLVEEIPTEGAAGPTTRRFGADLVTFEDPDPLSVEERAAIAEHTVLLLLGDVSAAAAAGTFAARDDDLSIRMYGEVDQACLDQLGALHMSTYREMLAAIKAGRERIATGPGPGIEIATAIFLFEAPLWGETLAGSPAPAAPRSPSASGASGAHGREDAVCALSPDKVDELAAALVHPLRGRILTAMTDRPDVTIRELAARVGESPRRVRHAVEALLAAGLAEVSGEVLRPGVLERRYGARPWVLDEGSPVSAETRVVLSRAIVLTLMADVAAGSFGTWKDECQVRMYGQVDEACRAELVDVQRRAYSRILRAMEAGRERVRESGARGTEVVSALFLFEAPLWHAPRASPGSE